MTFISIKKPGFGEVLQDRRPRTGLRNDNQQKQEGDGSAVSFFDQKGTVKIHTGCFRIEVQDLPVILR